MMMMILLVGWLVGNFGFVDDCVWMCVRVCIGFSNRVVENLTTMIKKKRKKIELLMMMAMAMSMIMMIVWCMLILLLMMVVVWRINAAAIPKQQSSN